MRKPFHDPDFEAFASRLVAREEVRETREPNTWHGLLWVAFGICLAGAAYPVLIALGVAGFWATTNTYEIVFGAGEVLRATGVLGMLMPLAFGTLMYGLIGFIVSGITVAFVLPVYFLIVRSLDVPVHLAWLGGGCGGLVGFLAVLPLWLEAGVNFDALWNNVLRVALGPRLSTIVGQVGGAWGGRRAKRFDRALIDADTTPAPVIASRPEELLEGQLPKFQFGIRHLLWISLWLSILLTAMRLAGIPLEIALRGFGVWVIYQAAILYAGSRLANRLFRRPAIAGAFHVKQSAN